MLNGHGGNIDPMHVALRRLDNQFPEAVLTGAAYWDIAEAELAAQCQGLRKIGRPRLRDRDLDDDGASARPGAPRSDRRRSGPDAAQPVQHLLGPQLRPPHRSRGRRLPRTADAERGRRMLDGAISKVTDVARVLLETS